MNERYELFKNDLNNFGLLKWKAEKLSYTANFLDITIKIHPNRSISTTTFQKELNLYQYITPHSNHPKRMTAGIIYGLMRTYYLQNTFRSDYKRMATLLFDRFVARGWDRLVIRNYILESDRRLQLNPPKLVTLDSTNEDEPIYDNSKLFFHQAYHPGDIPAHIIQRHYRSHCADLFSSCLGIERLVVAYSRPQNISELCTKAKLYQVPGREVSKYVRGEL
jgi:hypothetical protein